ncbi:MAG TPA: LPS assembly lipoprotein LptE [Gammaproteobacteria bacterium]|nr:LPS assembly lipoprotein LptE [Gammaproteobacteria bacterium]
MLDLDHTKTVLASVARRYARAGAALGVALGLGGCGFHLQGSGSLPPALTKTYIATASPRSEFLATLTDTLRLRGSQIVDSKEEAQAVLDITADDTGQRVLSVSARNIPREYEVYYSVTFSLQVGGEQVITQESLVATRSYTYDETQVLAKAAEEDVLRRALAEDLARRLVRRIEVATPKT